MTSAATEAGKTSAALVAIVCPSLQGLVGYPLTSFCLKKETKRLTKLYRNGEFKASTAASDDKKGGKKRATSTTIILLKLAIITLAAYWIDYATEGYVPMYVVCLLLGPYVLDLLDPQILGISSELRQMALIIILIKAGLSLDLSDLKRVGRPAVLMAFVPASCEILGYVLFAPLLLGVSRTEAAVMGAVLSAVSPAVVVPRMLRLMEEKRGTEKSIPQLIMAGASCDDIFVIVLFTAFVGMAQGKTVQLLDFINIPVSILLGVAVGAVFGFLLALLFEKAYSRRWLIRNSVKVIIILGVSFLLIAVEAWVKQWVAVSGLLAVVSMACVLKVKSVGCVTKRLSDKFGKLWIAAEVILFVLVGAAVDIHYALSAGIAAVGMILIALAFRAVGVTVCLIGTPLTFKERLFCIIAYLPKATVQAAISSVPLAMGLSCGRIAGVGIRTPENAFGNSPGRI